MTICGSGQYLGQVEAELNITFTQWSAAQQQDLVGLSEEGQVEMFRRFLQEVYRLKEGVNILEILSTMLSADKKITDVRRAIKHELACSKKEDSLNRRKRETAATESGLIYSQEQ